jgi:hypothetical protein
MLRRGEHSCPSQDSNSDPSAVQPVASRYTDCATPLQRQSYDKKTRSEKNQSDFFWFLLFPARLYDLEEGGSITFRNDGYTAICNKNEGASSSVSDVGRYAIIMNLLRSAINVISAFVRRWEIQTYLRRNFLP